MDRSTVVLKPRIEVVDALRGFALLGLCLIHGIEHFDLLIYPESAPGWLEAIDPVAHGLVFLLFAGKAFAIFSFMFGLSFFIQMDRQRQRGVDFRWRFIWRLVLLFLIGYLFGLAYCGEILTIFAVLGVALVLLDKLGTKALLALSILMVANIPNAESGFRLVFAGSPFPGYLYAFDRRREEHGGHWYFSSDLGREGWLCPALFRYFNDAPEVLYCKAEPK